MGDNDDSWVDEIRISDGSAVIDRWLAEPEACTGFLLLCEDLLKARDYDAVFRRFVSFLYAEKVTASSPGRGVPRTPPTQCSPLRR